MIGSEKLKGEESVPGFEVDDNQHTSKESSPVNRQPSEDSRDTEVIQTLIPAQMWPPGTTFVC